MIRMWREPRHPLPFGSQPCPAAASSLGARRLLAPYAALFGGLDAPGSQSDAVFFAVDAARFAASAAAPLARAAAAAAPGGGGAGAPTSLVMTAIDANFARGFAGTDTRRAAAMLATKTRILRHSVEAEAERQAEEAGGGGGGGDSGGVGGGGGGGGGAAGASVELRGRDPLPLMFPSDSACWQAGAAAGATAGAGRRRRARLPRAPGTAARAARQSPASRPTPPPRAAPRRGAPPRPAHAVLEAIRKGGLPHFSATAVFRDMAFFFRGGQGAFVNASDAACRGLLLLKDSVPHADAPPPPAPGTPPASRGASAPASPAASAPPSVEHTLDEAGGRDLPGAGTGAGAAGGASAPPPPRPFPPRAAAARRLAAAAGALAREAGATNLTLMPGADRGRLDVVVITSPEAAAAAAMRAHLAAAPFFGIDSEGTYDKAMARDRMCILAVMAPACKGFKGAAGGQREAAAARGGAGAAAAAS
jgi:hypothetical protein